MGDFAERVVHVDQRNIVSWVVPTWLIQPVNWEKLLFGLASIAGSRWSSTAAAPTSDAGMLAYRGLTRRSV